MGCGSSGGQIINTRESVVKLEQILAMNNQKQDNIANGRIYLFGQTRTHRKIIECETKLSSVKNISNKTRIPLPKINLDPLESMYEQSQQIFHLGIYGLSMLPPFNNMLALYLQSNIIFMCGGRDYDHYNVKSEAFFYSAEDNKIMAQMSSVNELSSRLQTRPKYSRNRFQKMASMNKKRYSHMGIFSNKLKSILVFGGKNQNDETLASCQIYNILQNTWRDLPSMKTPRVNGHCFEYRDKIYIFGGRSNQVKLSKKIEVYSIEDSSWTLLKFKMHRGIQKALVFSQAPGQILIVGGTTHFYNCKTIIKIDLDQQTYVWDSQLNKEYNHVKGLKVGQDLFVFGGQKDCCEIFNKNKWKTGLFAHRKSVDLDELQDFTFTQESIIVKSSDRSQTQQTGCLQDQSVLFGSDEYPCLMFVNKKTGKIRKTPVPMNLRLKKNMEVVQLPKKVYMLLGGSDKQEKKISRTCFFYDASENTAVQSLKMSEKKINFAVVYFQDEVYVFGGFNPTENISYLGCQKFNLQNEKWMQLHTLNKTRYKTFAEKIGQNKIAVFGNEFINQPVKDIQIYYTKRDYFDLFVLKNEIPGKISNVYCLQHENKIIILREDEVNNLEEIEINQEELIDIELQKSAKELQQKIQSPIVHQNEDNSQFQSISNISQSKQKIESEYQSSQLHKNNLIAMKPRMIQIKPIKCNSQSERVKEEVEDSSFEIQKIVQYNKIMVQTHQSAFNKLRTAQNQLMPQSLHFQDDVRFSLENHSFQANLSTLKYKQSVTQKKQIGVVSERLIQDNAEKLKDKKSTKQSQVVIKQHYNIIKRQNQLYFFGASEVTVFDINKNEKVKYPIESQMQLKMLHIS